MNKKHSGFHGDSDSQIKSFEYHVERGCKRDRYALFYGRNPLADQGTTWGSVTLTKDNFGNHGSISAQYTTQDTNGEKNAVVTDTAPTVTLRSVLSPLIVHSRIIISNIFRSKTSNFVQFGLAIEMSI